MKAPAETTGFQEKQKTKRTQSCKRSCRGTTSGAPGVQAMPTSKEGMLQSLEDLGLEAKQQSRLCF